MRRLLLWLCAAAAVVAACKGLNVDKGNDFPCDFTQAPEVRDAACAPGEVCGVNGHCQRFVYEGPQFEGAPQFPLPDAGGKVHPLLLDQPVVAVAMNPSDRSKTALVTAGSDGTQRLWFVDATNSSFVTGGDPLVGLGQVQQVSLAADAGVMLLFEDGGTNYAAYWNGPLVSPPPPNLRQLRAGNGVNGLLRRNMNGFSTGGEALSDGGFAQFIIKNLDGGPDYGPDGGPFVPAVLDFHWLGAVPLVYTVDGFWTRLAHDTTNEADSGWVNLLAANEAPEEGGVPNFFRRDDNGNTWAIAYNFFDSNGKPTGNRLSTWLVGNQVNGNGQPGFDRAWADCTPCLQLTNASGVDVPGSVVAVSAKHLDVPTVEVVCSNNGRLTTVEVLGSSSADVTQSCVTRPLTVPFDFGKLAMRDTPSQLEVPVQDTTGGFTVAFGGTHGEVWNGLTFANALPLFLERVPIATGEMVLSDGGVATAAVTDQYVALQSSNNGFKTFRVLENGTDLIQPRTGITGAAGWFVDVSGRTLSLTLRPPQSPLLEYGPPLLDAHGDPAREPFFGEAVNTVDGKLAAFVMAADDSVYLVGSPTAQLDPLQTQGVLPQLSPEPGVPIRSFTLERTPLGTPVNDDGGIAGVRGYLVTSRNVFVYQLAGTPAHWSATQLPLSSGEPVEVWMDNPRGGLGRVGYRDGTVLTLPGGFLLAQSSQPMQVLDYDNYGGWPVAYAADGLYFAEWDYDGTLLNKTDAGVPSLPMSWRRQTLPDGSEPWLADTDAGRVARPARLQVTQRLTYSVGGVEVPESVVCDAGAGLESSQVFHLLLYLDDAVYEVGEMKRHNTHTPSCTR